MDSREDRRFRMARSFERGMHVRSLSAPASDGTMRRGTLAGRMAAPEAPAVYVYGAPRGISEGSLERLERPAVRRIRIDDAGHWPFLDQPDAFVETIRGFLAKASAL